MRSIELRIGMQAWVMWCSFRPIFAYGMRWLLPRPENDTWP
jgi:hypothetical protein